MVESVMVSLLGYGHLVPQTFTGQLVCIFFAMLGIPLILVTTADMGKFLAEYVSGVYDKYQWFLDMVLKRIKR